MGFRLQLYDETGAEIGCMTATRTDQLTFTPDRIHRTDTDGPEAYLRGVASVIEWNGAASTETYET
jgi:hypothetical protein